VTPISKKHIYVIALLAIVIIVVGVYTRNYYRQNEMIKVEVKPFKIGNGWGYDITVDNKVYIHQEFIPGISGNQSFRSKEDAIKTGNLVIKKIIDGNQLPGLSAEEITALGINLSQ
jgi:hypothetical protein